jgi:hypothetical protein
MQSVEDFMRQYFEERIAEEKREQASRAPFRRKFHTEDCRWDSRAGTLEMIETEKVLKVTESDMVAEVITARSSPNLPDSLHQLRYQLQGSPDGWLIRLVDLGCSLCKGEIGNTSCFFCHGTGWFDGKVPKTTMPRRDAPPPPTNLGR